MKEDHDPSSRIAGPPRQARTGVPYPHPWSASDRRYHLLPPVEFSSILLSNHGGRQLDRAAFAFHLLPEVVREVGKDTEILLDTLVGRAYLYGLMAGEREDVDQAIEILDAQLTCTMRIPGVTSLDEREPGYVTQLQQLILRARAVADASRVA